MKNKAGSHKKYIVNKRLALNRPLVIIKQRRDTIVIAFVPGEQRERVEKIARRCFKYATSLLKLRGAAAANVGLGEVR